MVSLGHRTLSFKGSMLERSQSSSADYGKNAHKKKLGQQLKKKRWEVNIKLSLYNTRRIEGTIIILKVSILTPEKNQLKCYTCDEIGNYAKNYPRNKINSHKKKNNKRRHHAHAIEDDEPSTKRIKQESNDSSSDEEYVLISLSRELSHM